MYAVEVRDHIMIAHSFKGAVFGPAQALHGATFVVDAAFIAEPLDDNGIVIDIGRAHEVLKSILGPLNYKNLDAVPAFAGRNTTTEFLTRHIHDRLADAARVGRARPRRQGAEGDPRHDLRIACRAGLVRGAAVWPAASPSPSRATSTALTGGYAYDRRIIAELRRLGWDVDLLALGDGFPRPSAEQKADRGRAPAGGRRRIVRS